MKTQKIGFESEERENKDLKDFLGDWGLITTNASTYSGKIIEINSDNIALLPYYKISYNEEGIEEYEIVYEGLPLFCNRNGMVVIRPTSEEETINFCKNKNKQIYLQKLREKVEIKNLEKLLKEDKG
jgi:hypothetical protein